MKNYFLVIVCIFCLAPVTAEADSVLRAGVLDFPPFYEIYGDGKEPTGILITLMKNILEQAGIKYTIAGLSNRRLYMNLASGETHLFIGVKGAPEYHEHVLYSQEQITEIDLRIYTLTDLPLPQDRTQLNGKNIIGIRGYSYGGLIGYLEDPANEVNLYLVEAHTTAFRMLQAGRSDFVLNYSLPAENAIRELKLTGIRHHSFYQLGLFMIVPQKLPQAEILMERLEAAYSTLKQEGKLETF